MNSVITGSACTVAETPAKIAAQHDRDVVVVLLSAQKHAPAFERGSLAVLYKGDVTPEWLSGLWERRSGSSDRPRSRS